MTPATLWLVCTLTSATVWIDPGGLPLGAFHVELVGRAHVQVDAVAAFTVIANGLELAGFQVESLTEPTGATAVAVVTTRRPDQLQVLEAEVYDTDGVAMAMAVTASGCAMPRVLGHRR